ncbi:sensor histidine kinase [Hydrogenophaga sp.]|uniref:sensor histidine kinase n=1 Tax=Hydrogenophaga sp. TaxID=1904254 RepID=UPI00271E649D|nr:sensor histidine kinase [Hydrogenophaga sp.]MDO9438113.1 sensor histidine kinase [Hydrogenophaga sp.]
MPLNGTELAALSALADHLARRRDAILSAWRQAVTQDASLSTGATLPKIQLNDHIPALLQGFEKQLRSPSSNDDVPDEASAHGLHRWQQGYGLTEVVRELGRLNECVVRELENCAALGFQAEVMASARMTWARVYSVAESASTAQYFKLQQMEAAANTREFEQALVTLREMEHKREALWREAVHDLRGNLGAVTNATAGLGSDALSPATREMFLRLLGRNVQALHQLLDDVTSLARLQSGQEKRQLDTVDVAALLGELWEALEGNARRKGLSFLHDGPSPFVVRTDMVKLRRIVQNLVLNAIRYTPTGTLELSWCEAGHDEPDRWALIVKDTGPGFGQPPSSAVQDALEVATENAERLEADARSGQITPSRDEDAIELPSWGPSDGEAHGEGIGLSIVKRLCELLDATVQVDSDSSGTTFRIVFPRDYA